MIPAGLCAREHVEQRLHLEAQHQVERRRAELDQQVAFAGAPHADRGMRGRRRPRRAVSRDCRPRTVGARAGLHDTPEAQLVAGTKLADFPQLGIDDGHRADESTEAGTVWAENHRHVAGEIDAADGVGIVVNIGRMQSCLAAVGARPGGLGADQAHAGATGVVVHFPVGREERIDVGVREEVRSAVRSVGHRDLPVVRVVRPIARRDRVAATEIQAGSIQAQHVARAQRPAAVSAELSEREGGAAAEVLGNVESAAHRKTGALAGSANRAEREYAAARYRDRFPEHHRPSVEFRVHLRAGERDHRIAVEAQRCARDRHLQRRGSGRIADHAIGHAMRQRIHRTRGRHADVPQAESSRPFLHGGQRAG